VGKFTQRLEQNFQEGCSEARGTETVSHWTFGSSSFGLGPHWEESKLNKLPKEGMRELAATGALPEEEESHIAGRSSAVEMC
jgi:hypothetical protein